MYVCIIVLTILQTTAPTAGCAFLYIGCDVKRAARPCKGIMTIYGNNDHIRINDAWVD